MNPVEKQQRILSAMDSLPNISPLARIGAAAGVEGLIIGDMTSLIAAGLVATVTAPLPPTTRFRLTTAGRDEAARIRQVRHPAVYTPEMAGGPPADALRDRVPREALAQAVADGRSLPWMSMKFDASLNGISKLLADYGLSGGSVDVG